MAKAKSVFVCQNCGAQRPRWEGRCTDCDAWNTFVEEVLDRETPTTTRQRGWSPAGTGAGVGKPGSAVLRLDENLKSVALDRVSTGYLEFDRVLGGGLVEGSFILLGGDPGIGKSTLLLQMAGGL